MNNNLLTQTQLSGVFKDLLKQLVVEDSVVLLDCKQSKWRRQHTM